MMSASLRRAHRRPSLAGLAFITASAATGAFAAPLEPHARRQNQPSNRTDNSPNPGGIAPQVWIPAVIVVLVLLGIFCLMWTRTGMIDRLRGTISPRTTTTTGSGAREVTAAALTNTTGGTGAGSTRPARARRTRRTPSQISTSSLPVYMKEPGDQELVIFRGPEEMEDATQAIAEAREAEDLEDDDASDRQSAIMRERDSRMYTPMPVPVPADTSRVTINLDNDGYTDSSTAELIPHPRERLRDSHGGAGAGVGSLGGNRASEDSRSTMDSASVLMRRASVPTDAPPDYEVAAAADVMSPPGLVEPASTSTSASASTSTTPSVSFPPAPAAAVLTAAAPDRASKRWSGFRGFGLFHSRTASRSEASVSDSSASASNPARNPNATTPPMPGAASVSPPQPAHVPDAAGDDSPRPSTSAIVNANANTPGSPRPSASSGPPVARHLRHRTSHSGGSGSTLNLPLFRTLSRQRSNNTLASAASRSAHNLTSPSVLSLGPAPVTISAPLAHTLTRTEIRYPRGGPTPAQVRLIASRESLGRFGVPYGADAVAAAAAASSRAELATPAPDPLDPPPLFESPTGENGPSFAHGGGAGGDEELDEEVDEDAVRQGRAEGGSAGRGEARESSASPPASQRARSRTSSPSPRRDRRQEASSASAMEASIPPRLLVPLFM